MKDEDEKKFKHSPTDRLLRRIVCMSDGELYDVLESIHEGVTAQVYARTEIERRLKIRGIL